VFEVLNEPKRKLWTLSAPPQKENQGDDMVLLILTADLEPRAEELSEEKNQQAKELCYLKHDLDQRDY